METNETNGTPSGNLFYDFGPPFRGMRGLIEQIKRDHSEWKRLRVRAESGTISMKDRQELRRARDNLYKELGVYHELMKQRQSTIEGVVCMEIGEIERELMRV